MQKIFLIITLFFEVISIAMQHESTPMTIDLDLYPFYYIKTDDKRSLEMVPATILNNARDSNGNTLLHVAIELKRRDIVKFLATEIGLTTIKNKLQVTPKELAKRSDDPIIKNWGLFGKFPNPNK